MVTVKKNESFVRKNDFVEVAFTGRITDSGEIFDTNISSDVAKAKLDIKDPKPVTLAVGHKMLPQGFDDDLEGKEVGKEYEINIKPELAFGKRDPGRIKMIPTKMFHAQKINPERGMQLNLDGQLVRILSSSSGRTLVDFNNPLAGKEVTYKYRILKKITSDSDKINAMQDFLFRRRFPFEIKEKIVTFSVTAEFEPFIKMFSEKFKEITGFETEAKVIPKEEASLKKEEEASLKEEKDSEKKE